MPFAWCTRLPHEVSSNNANLKNKNHYISSNRIWEVQCRRDSQSICNRVKVDKGYCSNLLLPGAALGPDTAAKVPEPSMGLTTFLKHFRAMSQIPMASSLEVDYNIFLVQDQGTRKIL